MATNDRMDAPKMMKCRAESSNQEFLVILPCRISYWLKWRTGGDWNVSSLAMMEAEQFNGNWLAWLSVKFNNACHIWAYKIRFVWFTGEYRWQELTTGASKGMASNCCLIQMRGNLKPHSSILPSFSSFGVRKRILAASFWNVAYLFLLLIFDCKLKTCGLMTLKVGMLCSVWLL